MKKFCPECEQEKDIKEFCFSNREKKTLQPYCDECRRIRAKRSYTRHRKTVIKAATARNKLMMERFQEFKKTLKCECCPEHEAACLDFHHRDPKKKDGILSKMVSRVGWDTLMREAKKCAVLCANCHRKVHAGVLKLK